jgi:hypothetical protein
MKIGPKKSAKGNYYEGVIMSKTDIFNKFRKRILVVNIFLGIVNKLPYFLDYFDLRYFSAFGTFSKL